MENKWSFPSSSKWDQLRIQQCIVRRRFLWLICTLIFWVRRIHWTDTPNFGPYQHGWKVIRTVCIALWCFFFRSLWCFTEFCLFTRRLVHLRFLENSFRTFFVGVGITFGIFFQKRWSLHKSSLLKHHRGTHAFKLRISCLSRVNCIEFRHL